MVKNTVRSASSMDPTIPGKLLRLFFHDCFVEGCDASILLQGNDTERSDPANKSLGAFSVIDSAKRVLEIFCPGVVSCADILALAARDAVELTGGPNIQIPTGRRDGRVSLAANVRPNIIDTSFTLNQMANIFSSKGLSMDDLVTLSGAHTIGSAHCSSFSDRFKLDSNGKFNLIDASLDREYAAELTRMCPAGASASITVNNDPNSPLLFDNEYYKELLVHKGLFQSDSALLNDERTKNRVLDFANNQEIFFESWIQSFLKLSSIGVKGVDEGEIRQLCSSKQFVLEQYASTIVSAPTLEVNLRRSGVAIGGGGNYDGGVTIRGGSDMMQIGLAICYPMFSDVMAVEGSVCRRLHRCAVSNSDVNEVSVVCARWVWWHPNDINERYGGSTRFNRWIVAPLDADGRLGLLWVCFKFR
ncbi:Peroxidase 46 [Olea europaea subsp. europaea]|uniref:Peroxidase n=1 Tax=Olea europaea subsp. europaea TaxID=158383 RepID=A0A8S0T8N3_OLEEU|nr:Peroxidase 46 [Olea europaea subsp. europaea]